MKQVATLKIYINDYDTGSIREETDDEEEEEVVEWGLSRSLTQSTWYLYEEIEVGGQEIKLMMMMVTCVFRKGTWVSLLYSCD